MIFKDLKESAALIKDVLRGVNQTVWGGAEGSQKASTIVKTAGSGIDSIVGVSHAIEDFACRDHVCFSLDCIGSASSLAGIVLGNIPTTKHLTVVTGSITCTCRGVRFICKRFGLAWSCQVAYRGSRYVITKIQNINC